MATMLLRRDMCQLKTEQIESFSPTSFPKPQQVKSAQSLSQDPFQYSNLPPEIRLEIQISALNAACTVPVSTSSARSALHAQSALLSTFYDPQDLPAELIRLYHTHSLFSFTSSAALAAFAAEFDRSKHVKHIEIRLSSITNPAQDWPFAILQSLPGVQSVTFVWDEPLADEYELEALVGWWGCYRDVFREGLPTGTKFAMRLVDGVDGIELGVWRAGQVERKGAREVVFDAHWKCIAFQGTEIFVKIHTTKYHRSLGTEWLLH